MTTTEKQICDLLNAHNNLQRPLVESNINLDRYFYIGVSSAQRTTVWACAEMRRAMFGSVEIRHLCVHPDHRRKGYALELNRRMLFSARQTGYHWAFCTTIETNAPMTSLLQRLGFINLSRILNPITSNTVLLWKRDLSDVPLVRNNSNKPGPTKEDSSNRSPDVTTHGAG